VVEALAPDAHTVTHPLRRTLPIGGQFTNRRNQASSFTTRRREQSSRRAILR
jgi:hypothetical protein